MINESDFHFDEKIIRDFFRELTVFPLIPVFQHEGILLKLFKLASMDQVHSPCSLQDRVGRYLTVWKHTLFYLYTKYLPHDLPDEMDTGFELTPFTYLLATDFAADITGEFELTKDDLAYIQTILDSLGLDDRLLPEVRINFILQIMLFPPLMALSSFYSKAYQWHAQSATALLGMVVNHVVKIPDYETNFALRFVSRFVSQKTYWAKGGIDGLIALPELAKIAEELQGLKDTVPSSKQVITDAICPHCGLQHKYSTIHRDDIVYAHLTSTFSDLHVQIGFNLYEAFQQDVWNAINEIGLSNNINVVKNITCVILVEGSTEELAIPEMALRIGKPLSIMNIRVMNCQSKQKLLEEFKRLSKNFPNMKLCALLDSDAEKEKRELEKMISGHRERFSLSFITKGTFEDLIPLPIVIQALNALYLTVGSVTESDFDDKREILKQIDKILWSKSNSTLDKVKFIGTAVRLMSAEDVPKLIQGLIDDAYKLSGGK